MTMKVSISEIRRFKSCRRKWWFQKIGIVQENITGARLFGIILHVVLENFYEKIQQGEPRKKAQMHANAIMQNQFLKYHGDLTDDGALMLSRLFNEYVDHWEEEDSKYSILGVEKWFSQYDLRWDVTFVGRADLIVQEKSSGSVYVVDHKTTSRFADTSLDFDEQVTAYIWLSKRVLGDKVKGFIYNGIKKVLPMVEIPQLKSGAPTKSVSKLTKMSAETYYKELCRLGLENDPEYINVQKQKSVVNPFFRRILVTRTTNEINSFKVDVGRVVQEMKEMSEGRVYAAPGLLCSWCEYAPLCRALNGGKSFIEVKALAKDLGFTVKE